MDLWSVKTDGNWKNCWGKSFILDKNKGKMKEKYLFTKSTFTKHNMTNDSLNTIEKLFKLNVMDSIHPSKMHHFEIQLSILSWDCNAPSVRDFLSI